MTVFRILSPCYFGRVLVLTGLIALLPAYASAQTSTGSGVATETRNVSGFHSIALGVPARLELRQGNSEGLSITGDANILPLVETVVENGALKIRWMGKGNYSTHNKPLDIVVDARSIDGLTVGGSGQIHAVHLKSNNLRTIIGGSGEIAFDTLDADSVNATIGGSGRLSAAGRADALDVTVAGSGELSAAKLESRRAKVTLQGSSQATVWAKETLNATVAGSGQITYHGKPQVSRTVAGSGSVRQAGDAS